MTTEHTTVKGLTMKRAFWMLALILAPNVTQAMNIDWTGTYRAEWMQVDRPSLTTPSQAKAYGLNYLSLSPKMTASDGLTINGKFDVLGSNDVAYENSQTGQLFGANAPSTLDSSSRNVDSQAHTFSPFRVSQLYLTLDQEYGSLLVGRAPYEFGLGMLYNAGNGSFDHWLTTSDYVAYKVLVGNLSFMPMLGRVSARDAGASNVVQDEVIQVQYESKDTGSLIGAVMSRRKSAVGAPGNDINPDEVLPGATSVNGSYSMTTTGFVLGRSWEAFQFKMEAQFVKGNYGVQSPTTGEDIANNSYGIAIDMQMPRPQSKWEGGLKLGMASGDNPDTEDREGFFFHRNYDFAMLLFNHRLGQEDFLGTDLIKDTSAHGVGNSLDDETISNVVYLAPELRYAWNPQVSIINVVTYAQLLTAATNSGDRSKSLGTEWDIGVAYKPRENVLWENRLGLLFPGGAFKGGSNDYDDGFTFGFQSRAAITF